MSSVLAEDTVFNTSFFTDVAVESADIVNYFKAGTYEKGSSDHEVRYQGAVWRFISQENLQTFIMNPDMYLPQYGGYCAYAMARGDEVSIDPEAWTIHEGKLYLNYSLRIGKRWKEDMLAYIEQADAHWEELITPKKN